MKSPIGSIEMHAMWQLHKKMQKKWVAHDFTHYVIEHRQRIKWRDYHDRQRSVVIKIHYWMIFTVIVCLRCAMILMRVGDADLEWKFMKLVVLEKLCLFFQEAHVFFGCQHNKKMRAIFRILFTTCFMKLHKRSICYLLH